MDWNEHESHARALVCVVCTLADFERIQHEHWYRIPLRHAPVGLAAEYLAFYPTAKCGQERWQIRWIAPVQAIRIARRIDLLPDQPNHPRAQDRYYQVVLGTLALLPTPIPSKRLRRVSFIPTTLGALLTAHDLRDTWHAAAGEPPDVWGAGIGRRAMRR